MLNTLNYDLVKPLAEPFVELMKRCDQVLLDVAELEFPSPVTLGNWSRFCHIEDEGTLKEKDRSEIVDAVLAHRDLHTIDTVPQNFLGLVIRQVRLSFIFLVLYLIIWPYGDFS